MDTERLTGPEGLILLGTDSYYRGESGTRRSPKGVLTTRMPAGTSPGAMRRGWKSSGLARRRLGWPFASASRAMRMAAATGCSGAALGAALAGVALASVLSPWVGTALGAALLRD